VPEVDEVALDAPSPPLPEVALVVVEVTPLPPAPPAPVVALEVAEVPVVAPALPEGVAARSRSALEQANKARSSGAQGANEGRTASSVPERAGAPIRVVARARSDHDGSVFPRAFFALTSPLAFLAFGCSATGNEQTFADTSSSTASAGGSGGASSSSTSAETTGVGGGFGGGFGTGGAGQGGGPELIAEVYGNSPDVLYKLDPDTKQVITIGSFQGCDSVIDIALDKDSNLYGTTFGGLYRIDRDTAVCTLISQGTYPNSLSFVPAGTVHPTEETLVGYEGSTYVKIDTQTGLVVDIGALSGGLASSGDIVSVKNGKTLLTVNGTNCNDCIVEVNPATGDLVKNWGSLGFGSVFGLAFWAGSAYGFDSSGDLFQIDFANNVLSTAIIPIPGSPDLVFWGAGSTTSAPPDPIPE